MKRDWPGEVCEDAEAKSVSDESLASDPVRAERLGNQWYTKLER
jgi:hypothetical protein